MHSRKYLVWIGIAIIILLGILISIFGPQIGENLQAPHIAVLRLTGITPRSRFCIESCTQTTYHYQAQGTEATLVGEVNDSLQKLGYKLGNYNNDVNPSGYVCTESATTGDVYGYYKPDSHYSYPPTMLVSFVAPQPSPVEKQQIGCDRPAANYKIDITPEAGN